MGELEKWGRALVSAPVVTSAVAGYLTDKAASAIGSDSQTLDPLVEDVSENLHSRADWVEGMARSATATISGARRKAEEHLSQIEQQWRTEAGQLYSWAGTTSEVDAVESGMRDGFTGSMRHYEIADRAARSMYLRAWKWSRGWFGRMAALRKDVRSQVGLRLADFSGQLATRRRQAVQARARAHGSGGAGDSRVERLKDGLRAIASYADATTAGLEGTIEDMGRRIQAIDGLLGDADVDGRNLIDHLVHAVGATRAAADELLLVAAESTEQADRL